MRVTLTTPRFITAAALANTALYHLPLFAYARANLDMGTANGWLTLATLAVLATAASALIFGLIALASQRALKPVMMVAAVGNSVAVYFVQAYGVILDKAMMGNVFNTDVGEASALFHPTLLIYVALLGALPCWLLTRVTVVGVPVTRRLAYLGFVLAGTVGWAYANSKTWLWIDKNSKRVGGMTMPWSYAINGPRRLAELARPREQKPLPPVTASASGKTIVLLLIGEAARAENFSLYGYARETDPEMKAEGAVALPHARACATYTTAALLCILSHKDGGDAGYEPLTSYLSHNGVDVIFRTNNWGEPPMTVQTLENANALRPSCTGDACEYDEVLYQGLEQRIRASASDRVFVTLHLAGSHGPAYSTKYPAKYAAFTPVCTSVELSKCTPEALMNAYDDSILYADHIAALGVELLKKFGDTPAVMIYLSDHGESLGEYGLYLHGTPYSIAPDVQKDIPFVVWMNEAFRKRTPLPAAQLAPAATHSQANVFHSIMGAFGLRSEVYQRELDIFAPPGAP